MARAGTNGAPPPTGHADRPGQDVARFNDRAACIEEQYQRAFTYAEGEFNTKLTLGENIADNVGVAVAYRAWQQLQEDDADEDLSSSSSSTRRLLEEVPSSQLFFIAMAQKSGGIVARGPVG